MLLFVGALLGAAGGYGIGRDSVRANLAPAISEPATIGPTPTGDEWVRTRLRAWNDVCGPVPFHVSITKDKIEGDCGRPENVGAKKVGR